MRVQVLGAAGEVTGSAYLVETERARVLVDFGMFQGGDEDAETPNDLPDDLDAAALDAVLVTHAHLDHVGRLPLLTIGGFGGPVYATGATLALAEVVLEDAGKIQEQDAQEENERRVHKGLPALPALYHRGDVGKLLALGREVPFQQEVEVAPGVRARWIEAGHMLGSASIKLTVQENSHTRWVIFSGDLGPRNAPILRVPETFRRADLVFLESTYGDRDHRGYPETVAEFEAIMRRIIENGGKAILPAFAVGRTQLLLYLFASMFRRKVIEPFPIYLDSPMALEATKIYFSHPELVDDEARERIEGGDLTGDLDIVQTAITPEQSRLIHDASAPCAIIASSGMCEAGRIVHHLRENLPNHMTEVVMTGYQAQGTLGRRLVQGAQEVEIAGERVEVRARVHTLNGFSAHAGRGDLLRWFEPVAESKPHVALTHGEDAPRAALAAALRDRFGVGSELPGFKDVIDL